MRLQAITKSRCPYCLKGEIFINFWKMHKNCDMCGIQYEREQGYFMMAVFVGYVINFAVLVPLGMVLYFRGVTTQQFIWTMSIVLILLAPFVFRYARVIWLHVDELLDPRPSQDRPS